MNPGCIHYKHRSRMKQKFLENSSDSYYPHQLLEMLLFYTIPRIDTNPASHRLLNRFSSLENVMNASPDELMQVQGIGPASAYFICAMGEMCRRYSTTSTERTRFASVTDLKEYFISNFSRYPDNSLVILSLNNQLELIGADQFDPDRLASDPSASRLIVGTILKGGTDRIAACIFHSCAPPLPDGRDYFITRTIAEAAAAISTELIDMVICTGKSAFSMKETGAFSFSLQ